MTKNIKVTETQQSKKYVPQIKISGKWLAELGFVIGSGLEIQVTENQILITKTK